MNETPNDTTLQNSLEPEEISQNETGTEASTDSEVEEPASESVVEPAQSIPMNIHRPWAYSHPREGEVGNRAELEYPGVPEGFWTHQGMSYQTPSPSPRIPC